MSLPSDTFVDRAASRYEDCPEGLSNVTPNRYNTLKLLVVVGSWRIVSFPVQVRRELY